MADFQEEGIMAEELRLIAQEEARDRLFWDRGLLSPTEEGFAMDARDVRAKKRKEENNEREVRRRLAHEALVKPVEVAVPRVEEVAEEAGQEVYGSGDRQDEYGEEMQREMFPLRTPEEWAAYFALIGSQRYANMGTPTEEDGEEEDVVVEEVVEEDVEEVVAEAVEEEVEVVEEEEVIVVEDSE